MHRLLLLLIGMQLSTACSPDNRKLAGIWHSDLEAEPGFVTPFDFELRHNLFSGKWRGKFELPEMMVAADMRGVAVKDSGIVLDLGAGTGFNGRVSDDQSAIEGILKVPGEQDRKLRFTKSTHWSSQVPARAGPDGRPVTQWRYAPPAVTGDGWQAGDMRKAGHDPKGLDSLLTMILQGKYHGLDALLVAQAGRLVLEEYFYLGGRDKIHSVQSVTKSVNSLLIGIARDHGLVKNLDAPLAGFFPAYPDSVKKDTLPSLRHALTMSAALDWKEDIPYSDPQNDAVRMNVSSDMYAFVLSRKPDPEHNPGEKFEYNSGLSVLLGGVLMNVTGKPADEYAKQTLFKELGINKFSWTKRGGKVHTGGGLFLRPRDLLKIGQLVLDKGKWNGQQVVSESWIQESTAFKLPISDPGKHFGYGYQWWRGVFRYGTTTLPLIYASGYGGQMLYIVPDLKLVALTYHHNASDIQGSHSITYPVMQNQLIPAFR